MPAAGADKNWLSADRSRPPDGAAAGRPGRVLPGIPAHECSSGSRAVRNTLPFLAKVLMLAPGAG